MVRRRRRQGAARRLAGGIEAAVFAERPQAGSHGVAAAGKPVRQAALGDGDGEIAQHVEWMQAQGYAAATIDYALDMFAKFFRWCTENQVDPEVATGFNPAAGVPRPKRPRYAGVKLLSRRELGRLLGLQGSKDEEDWAESVLEALRLAAKERGEELDVKAVRAEARGDEPNLGAATRLLVEEIASVRVALRRAFNLAMASQEVGDLVRLTDIYGHGCFRLVKLLKADKGDQGKLEAYLRGGIDQALDEVTKEWGLRGDA